MIYYITLFLILLILAVNYEITGYKKGKNILIFMIIFILAFNYQMGTDWFNYQRVYENIIPNISFSDFFSKSSVSSLEKGYILLNVLFFKLGFNYELFMGITLSICIYILLNIIYEKSDNYYLSFFIFIVAYLLINAFEPVIRQLISVTILAYGFKYIEKRKLFKYLLVVVLAFCFHQSAVIGVFIYFIPLIKIKLKNIFLVTILIYALILMIPFILETISKIIPILEKYINYLNSVRYGRSYQKSILRMLYSLITLFGYFYVVFYCYKYSNKRNKLYKNMAIIYILIGYFSNLLPILYRVNQYLVLGFSICMGSVGKFHLPSNKVIRVNHKKLDFLFVFMLYFLFLLNFSRIFSTELNRVRYLNYKNYFIEMVKGNLKENFKEKKKDYEETIEKLIKKENNTLRRE